MQELLESALDGARDPALAELGEAVEVVTRPALVAGPVDALEADGYLLGTPANIGYISGALKHFFDTIYYPCLEATRGRPFAAYVHGNLDQAGAVRAIEAITTGLQWRGTAPVLPVTRQPDAAMRGGAHDPAATGAAPGAPDPAPESS